MIDRRWDDARTLTLLETWLDGRADAATRLLTTADADDTLIEITFTLLDMVGDLLGNRTSRLPQSLTLLIDEMAVAP